MTGNPSIIFNDVGVRYSTNRTTTWALREVNLTLRSGLTIVLGVSGSGKSTLLSLAGLLRRPTQGSVSFFGKPTESIDATSMEFLRADCVGFVFQDHALVPHLSLLENVMLPLLVRRSRASTEQARALLDKIGLADHVDKLPSEVSFGQAQRAALCRGMIRQPRVILADEVTASLDAPSARIILDMLREAAEAGVTVVFATHDERLASLADTVVELEDGGRVR